MDKLVGQREEETGNKRRKYKWTERKSQEEDGEVSQSEFKMDILHTQHKEYQSIYTFLVFIRTAGEVVGIIDGWNVCLLLMEMQCLTHGLHCSRQAICKHSLHADGKQ